MLSGVCDGARGCRRGCEGDGGRCDVGLDWVAGSGGGFVDGCVEFGEGVGRMKEGGLGSCGLVLVYPFREALYDMYILGTNRVVH